MLNRMSAYDRVNHKRVYRTMKQAGLLLPKYGPTKPERRHDGKVMTLKSDLRWRSDGFQFRCWSGEVVHIVFSSDCYDREAIAWHASTAHPVEWLSDNRPPYSANETRQFGADHGLLIHNTPADSPESNGMAEAFAITFKRDYVYVSDVSDAETVIAQLDDWFRDYNEVHPHKGLKMLSP